VKSVLFYNRKRIIFEVRLLKNLNKWFIFIPSHKQKKKKKKKKKKKIKKKKKKKKKRIKYIKILNYKFKKLKIIFRNYKTTK